MSFDENFLAELVEGCAKAGLLANLAILKDTLKTQEILRRKNSKS